MPFTLVRQDITKMQVDVIVNAANTALQMGGGVCGAIYKAAGSQELQAACLPLAPIQTGDAVMTSGFRLPAKHIIHTAGPVYKDGKHQEEQQLRSCYRNSLKLAADQNCESIAFPLISSGIFGYPKAQALQVAVSAIREFLEDHEMEVYLVVFDKAAFTVSENLFGEVANYINEHYVDIHTDRRRSRKLLDVEVEALQASEVPMNFAPAADLSKALDEWVGNLDEPFSDRLLRLIDAKGRTDVEVYKRANLDRKLFSKIRTGKGYMPSKRTAVALAVALELTLDETEDLLRRAGYALSRSQKFDVIVEYFIVNGHYEIYEINEVLFKYDQPLLGG
ncbi:MAG: macro domain-containing protein [Paenibacillus sp.]|uniref:macro domain-containing protein n=1 Tax=Paenibacillus sp. TaxID=58172 RepID=UPI002900E7CD|nr:macro domain-containing protein [Paenibacillus sp.]MDU2242036.1 macro domain-containing protein [Paenibacillus sp.]